MYKNVIALDTSMGLCSIAIRYKQQLLQQTQVATKDYAQTILPILNGLLLQAKTHLSEINSIVYTNGPGSYTGLRISCAVVQGICFIHDITALGISSLALLAQSIYRQYGHSQVLVMRNAHMQQIYWGYYKYCKDSRLMQPIISDRVSPAAEVDTQLIDNYVIAGDGWYILKQHELLNCQVDTIYPDFQSNVVDAIDFVDNESCAANQLLIEEIVPVYLRDESQWKKSGQH